MYPTLIFIFVNKNSIIIRNLIFGKLSVLCIVSSRASNCTALVQIILRNKISVYLVQ